MKTFKLKALDILESNDEDIIHHEIPLLDGLIINREDDQNRWVIEAYVNHSLISFFKDLKERKDEVMIQVKITKESNTPATFITQIITVNEIGPHMNVLFMGTIIDRQKGIIKETLQKLVEEGYQGESLIKKFKEEI
ncbi:YwpF family protein [Virgibacillus ndiopensis]|uniref:YwpF family protein n=1 Tax=Virgibacillus ndiopensis TaxID=2004408 RepID=UPI000C069EE7|nr:YwpF family protein [Virgibacillus ndiopensis]